MSILYVMATPIGNLEDLSFRALRILKEVDFVISEDTRTTLKLLARYEIKKPLVSYHQHSKLQKVDGLISRLKGGQTACLVSEAGTPGISDPGGQLVNEALKNKIKVVAMPGPSALTAAISIAGLPADRFLFLGFLPHKKGRETCFKRIAVSEETVIFYESPYRLMKALESLSKNLGPERMVVVTRELTKKFEEMIRGKIEEVYNFFKDHPEKVRGEFVVLVAGGRT